MRSKDVRAIEQEALLLILKSMAWNAWRFVSITGDTHSDIYAMVTYVYLNIRQTYVRKV